MKTKIPVKTPIMTPEEFEALMDLARCEGPEEGHMQMDDLMCHVLRQLGYKKGVKHFENMSKWYA